MSILKVFIGIPEIKTSVSKTDITVSVYNKQKIYFMNLFHKSFKLFKNVLYKNKTLHFTGSKNKIFSPKNAVYKKISKRNNIMLQKDTSLGDLPTILSSNYLLDQISPKISRSSRTNLVLGIKYASSILGNKNKSSFFIEKVRNYTTSSYKVPTLNLLGKSNSKIFSNKNLLIKKIRSKFAKYMKTIKTKIVVKRPTLPLSKRVSGRYIKSSNKNVRIFLADKINTKSKFFGSNNKKIRRAYNKTQPSIRISSIQPDKRISSTQRNKRMSYSMRRKYNQKVQNLKNRIILNIFRKKSLNVVFYSLKKYFEDKGSIYYLKRLEKHNIKLFQNLRSIKFFILNLYDQKGLVAFQFTSNFVFTL
jgi:hypothetical protein